VTCLSPPHRAIRPADEAATREKLDYRINHAGDLFMGAVASMGDEEGHVKDSIIGYICGTLANSSELTHESMSKHEPGGRTLCIHSVCVESASRRQGLATRMLRAYPSFVREHQPQIDEIRLICKAYLVQLYQQGGFDIVGPSPVVHGQDPWIEMKLDMAQVDAKIQQLEELDRKRRSWYF